MIKASQHNFNDNGKCKKCGLTEEYIADNKISTCKAKTKSVQVDDKKIKDKKFI